MVLLLQKLIGWIYSPKKGKVYANYEVLKNQIELARNKLYWKSVWRLEVVCAGIPDLDRDIEKFRHKVEEARLLMNSPTSKYYSSKEETLSERLNEVDKEEDTESHPSISTPQMDLPSAVTSTSWTVPPILKFLI